MTILYAATLLLSAFLVFWVQPLVARMLLPALGGSPQVWNTCVFFFQGMLLVGYLYSHVLTKRFSIRGQGVVHAMIFVAAMAVVPRSPGVWVPPEEGSVVLWLLARLFLYIGLPYAVLSSSAPLLQSWYGASGQDGSRDPYFLYAASNFGSLLALLIFPTFLERHFRISEQTSVWGLLFLWLALGVVGCLAWVWNADTRAEPTELGSEEVAAPSVPGRQVTRWVVMAFVPSSLMLGVTTHITTDIAAVSFLWVLPLALYLATFIAAFSKVGEMSARFALLGLPLLAFVAGAILLREGSRSLWLVPIELLLVASISMVLHRRLYEQRPPVQQLTNFYLWVSFGGFLGGLLNGFLAPFLFDRILEYPLVLTAGYLMIEAPVVKRVASVWRSASWHGLQFTEVAGVVLVMAAFSWFGAGAAGLERLLLTSILLITSALAAVFAVGPATAWRAITLLGLFVYLGFPILERGGVIHSDRSFFGNFSVLDTEELGYEIRRFAHGTTAHGVQALDSERALEVTGYYFGVAPVLERFLATRPGAQIGVTGLGSGNIACLSKPGDAMTFFEIDPAVVAVARRYFTYLDQCEGEIDVVTGDARLSLLDVAEETYDMLVLDAFSSDSVPVHLLTLEASQIYERVLKDNGLLAFHVSNHYLDLEPVLAELAAKHGWTAYGMTHHHNETDPLDWPSSFVLVSKTDWLHPFLRGAEEARQLTRQDGFSLWTDDSSSLLSVLRW